MGRPLAADVPVYNHRDGGAAGDALIAGLVGVSAPICGPAVAQLRGNWELKAGEDWRDRITGGLEGTEVDGSVIQRDQQDVAEQGVAPGGPARHPERRPGGRLTVSSAGQILDALAALTENPVQEVQSVVMPTLRALVADGLH